MIPVNDVGVDWVARQMVLRVVAALQAGDVSLADFSVMDGRDFRVTHTEACNSHEDFGWACDCKRLLEITGAGGLLIRIDFDFKVERVRKN